MKKPLDKDPYKTAYETGYTGEVPTGSYNMDDEDNTQPTGKLIIVNENPEYDPTDDIPDCSNTSWLGSMVNEIHKDWDEWPERDKVEFKFDEKELCEELLDYIASTYGGHYTGEKYQATDLIIDAGHGEGFCLGNIIKYAKRYGKKDGYSEKDILKILHYGIILWHVHRKLGR